LLLLLSSVGFATLSILTKLAYAYGATALLVLAMRYVVGALVFSPFALQTVRRSPHRGRIAGWLAVAACYVISTGSFWLAIQIDRVSEVAPILYVFPGIILLIERFGFKATLGLAGASSVALGMAGSILVVGAGFENPRVLLGSLLAVVAAVATAVEAIIASRAIRSGDQVATASTMFVVSAVVFVALGLIAGFPSPSSQAWLLMIAIAAVGALLPLSYLEGIARAGASRSALTSVSEPVLIVVLALVVLREQIVLLQAVGIGMVLVGFGIGARWMMKGDVASVEAR